MSPIHSSWLALGAKWVLNEGMANDRTVVSTPRRVTARVRTARAAQSRGRGPGGDAASRVPRALGVIILLTLLYVQ